MSKTEWTPGPWRVMTISPEIKVNPTAEFMPFGSCGCCDGVWINGDNPEANAHLIAAAPDLYTALLELYQDTASYIEQNDLGEVHHGHSMKLARAALKSARGEQ